MQRLLEKHNPNVNLTNNKGQNILMMCGKVNIEVIKLLFKRGINLYHQDHKGNNSLIYAAKNDDLQLVKFLISAAGKKFEYVNVSNNQGENPLITAIKYKSSHRIVKYLIENKADINKEDDKGNISYPPKVDTNLRSITAAPPCGEPHSISNFDSNRLEICYSARKLAKSTRYYDILDNKNVDGIISKAGVESNKEAEICDKVMPKSEPQIELRKIKIKDEVSITSSTKKTMEVRKRLEQKKEIRERKLKEVRKQTKPKKEPSEQKLVVKISDILKDTKKNLSENVDIPGVFPQLRKGKSALFTIVEKKQDKVSDVAIIDKGKEESDLDFLSQIKFFLLDQTEIYSSPDLIKAMLKGSFLYRHYVGFVVNPADIDIELIARKLPNDIEELQNFIYQLFPNIKTLDNFKIWKTFDQREIENVEFILSPEVTGVALSVNIIIRDSKYPNYPPKDWVANFDSLRLVYKDDMASKKITADDNPKLTFCSHLQNQYKIKYGIKAEECEVELLLGDLKNHKYELNVENRNERRIKKYAEMGVEFLSESMVEKMLNPRLLSASKDKGFQAIR